MDGDYYEELGYNRKPQDPAQDADPSAPVFDSFFSSDQDTAAPKDGKSWLPQDLEQKPARPFVASSLFPGDNTAIGPLFPAPQAELSWSMPGAYKTADAMDLDQSPPFTVELDLYFDAMAPTMNGDRMASGLTPTMFDDDSREQAPYFAKLFEPDSTEFGYTGTDNLELRGNNPGSYNFQMQPEAESQQTVNVPMFNINPGANQDLYAQAFTDPSQMASHTMSDTYTPDNSESIFQNASIATPEEDINNMHSGIARRDFVRHRASLLVHGADLLPLTTTTSLTPSVSSLHLTQPSFFSANQFVRSLFDQPPSLVHRPSIDLYSRQRLSIDSQNSGVPSVQNTSRSFSSYIPFMGDRDRERKLPGAPNPAEWSQPGAGQPRHLIRSIFKSNNSVAGNPDSTELPEDPMFTDTYEEDQLGMIQEGIALKKSKRPRRSLFTRLRPGKSETERQENSFSEALKSDTQESESSIKLESRNFFQQREADGNELFKQEALSPKPSRLSALEAELIKLETHNSVRSNEREFASNSNPINQIMSDSQEPDYGALFQGVGKRRNLVVMKSKKTKAEANTKSEVKQEPDISGDRLSLTNARSSNDDGHLSQSLTFSQTSSMSSDSYIDGHGQGSNGGSSFATASKRILGSRLLKRRGNVVRSEPQAKPQAEPHSDVVEIDLESLDLPPNTEILPQINPNSRTRGRKEDKAADMEDQSKIYVCGYCSRRFKRQEHLKRHFRSLHTSEKPYECPICQKKFSRTDNLNQHLKVHKQEDEENAGEQSDE